MRATTLVAMLIPLLLLVGCAKKTVKNTAPAKDETASAKPQTPPKNDKKADEPNWLTDPRFKKEKDELAGPQNAGPSGKPPPIAPAPNLPVPPGQGVLQPQPQPAPQPANPPATPTPAPKFEAVTEHDMKDVWIFIENASLATGSMPPPNLVFEALVRAKSPAAELVKNGSIILTGAGKRESVWAFEARAATQGGLIASQNGVDRVTVAQLKAMLGIR